MTLPRPRPRFALALVLLVGASGCRTTTVINSEPQGARVLVDGVEGFTPFSVGLPITTFGSYPVRIEADGYEAYEGELPTEANVWAIVLGLCFPPAWLWDWNRAVSSTTIELRPLRRFPQDESYEEPFTPFLPPLPPTMEETRPAPSPKPARR